MQPFIHSGTPLQRIYLKMALMFAVSKNFLGIKISEQHKDIHK